MSYIEESLSAGEKVGGVFKQHWVVWLPFTGWVLLGFVTFGLTWLIAIYEVLRLRFMEHGVTNKRVVFKSGIISRKTQEMKVTSVETVEIDQGVLGRLLGFGTVRITGRGISDVLFRVIDDPIAVKRQIESIDKPIE